MEYISNIIANQSSPPAGCTKEHSFSSHNLLSTGCRHQLHTSPGMTKVAPVDPDGEVSPDSDGEVSVLEKRLLKAAEEGNQEEVKELLESNGFSGQTPLHFAAEFGPLHLAVEKGHRDIVDLLLEKKAQIEAKDRKQQTHLHRAVEKGHRDIVDLLLEKKAQIEAKDRSQQTPLHRAVDQGKRDIVDLLLEKKADIEAKDQYRRTPLHLATNEQDRQNIVTLLLQKGADLGAQNFRGNTPLSFILVRPGSEYLRRVLAEMVHLWRRSVLVEIIQLDNQDWILNLLKSWPQNARLGPRPIELKRASVPERLRTVLAPPHQDQDGRLHASRPEFSAQNLFWAQEVPVTLKHLPGVWGSDAVNEDFLKTLADCPHDGIFETDAVQAMVLAAWQQYRAFTLLEIVSCFLTVICLCWASYGFRHGFALSAPALYLVVALHLKKSLDESVQALPHLVQCLKCSANQGSYMSFDNAADALYLVGGWFAIARQLFIGSDELEKPWMAVFAAAAWLRLLYSLRAETWMGPRLLPIISAVKDTFAFFLLMVICIASAAHAYYNLQLREEPTPTYAALMQVVRLGVFGDFDLFEFEGLDPTYRLKDDGNDNESQNEWEPIDPSPGPDYFSVHVLFYMTGVGITVLLMNVLIGVLSSNYERYEAQSVGQFFRTRVKMLVELQGRPLGRIFSVFCRTKIPVILIPLLSLPLIMFLVVCFLVCLLFFRRRGMKYTIYCSLGLFGDDLLPASECRIFLVVRDEPDGNEVRSLRAALKIPLERMQTQQQDLESKLEKHHQDLESKIETKLDNMEKHHQDLASKIEKVEHTISHIHELLLEVTRTGRKNSAEEPEGPDALFETLEASPQVEMERLRETATGR